MWIEARSLARALRDSASVVAVDLRGEPLFQAGHVERAVCLSLQDRAEEAAAVLRRRLGAVGIAGSETVVLYDGWPEVVLLDLREARDYEMGHLPGAVNFLLDTIPLSRLVAEKWPGVDRAKANCILYCYGTGCVRSWNGSSVAVAAGFQNVLWLRDGFPAWLAAGYPVLPQHPGASAKGPERALALEPGSGAAGHG